MAEIPTERLRERLAAGPFIVADGAMGSLLQERGHQGCLERLNLDHPDVVRAVHREYILAGAEIIWTNSFGGSPLGLAAHGLSARTEEVNRSAARIAREAAGDSGAWIAGSVGPCGAFLPPGGDLAPESFTRDAGRQIGALIEGGVDAIAIETMMDVEEAILAFRAAREIAPAIPIFATLTFQERGRGSHRSQLRHRTRADDPGRPGDESGNGPPPDLPPQRRHAGGHGSRHDMAGDTGVLRPGRTRPERDRRRPRRRLLRHHPGPHPGDQSATVRRSSLVPETA